MLVQKVFVLTVFGIKLRLICLNLFTAQMKHKNIVWILWQKRVN